MNKTSFTPKKSIFYQCCLNCKHSKPVLFANRKNTYICTLTGLTRKGYDRCDVPLKNDGKQIEMDLRGL